ncbi:MAG TPA: hypothetical protein VF738_00960 [Rhodanobacter sp.]
MHHTKSGIVGHELGRYDAGIAQLFGEAGYRFAFRHARRFQLALLSPQPQAHVPGRALAFCRVKQRRRQTLRSRPDVPSVAWAQGENRWRATIWNRC